MFCSSCGIDLETIGALSFCGECGLPYCENCLNEDEICNNCAESTSDEFDSDDNDDYDIDYEN